MVLFLFFVLIICFIDIVMILWWEILSWSLMGVIGLKRNPQSVLLIRPCTCWSSGRYPVVNHWAYYATSKSNLRNQKKKTSHIENNSQFNIETLILSLLQFLCSLISRFILSFAVFFFCLFHVFYINLEVHIVSYLK